MANNVLRWAWNQGGKPSERFVLIAIADRAKQDGTAYPGLKDLSKRTGYSTRTVSEALSGLEAAGLIEPLSHRKGGHGKATVWRCCINLEDSSTFKVEDDDNNLEVDAKNLEVSATYLEAASTQPSRTIKEPSTTADDDAACGTCGDQAWECSYCAGRRHKLEDGQRILKALPQATRIRDELSAYPTSDVDAVLQQMASQIATGTTIRNPTAYAKKCLQEQETAVG